MPLYRIDIDTATRLVTSFLTQKTLYDYAVNKSIGGLISKNGFSNKHDVVYHGAMAWFCWKAHTPFLAFEEGDYDSNDMPKVPKSDILTRPENFFKYTGGVFVDEVRAFISRPVDPATISPDSKITKVDVISLTGGIPDDDDAKHFNKYPLGFFENKDDKDVETFLAQNDLTHVKYFYGFDDSSPYHKETNRIRIILIGVDSKGDCLVPTSLKTEPLILQKSWPPPPNS